MDLLIYLPAVTICFGLQGGGQGEAVALISSIPRMMAAVPGPQQFLMFGQECVASLLLINTLVIVLETKEQFIKQLMLVQLGR